MMFWCDPLAICRQVQFPQRSLKPTPCPVMGHGVTGKPIRTHRFPNAKKCGHIKLYLILVLFPHPVRVSTLDLNKGATSPLLLLTRHLPLFVLSSSSFASSLQHLLHLLPYRKTRTRPWNVPGPDCAASSGGCGVGLDPNSCQRGC